MKTEYPRKVAIKSEEDKRECPRIKKFPEIDPDESKRKKKLEAQQCSPPPLPLPIDLQSTICLTKERAIVKGLTEIASPVIARIELQKERGITKANFTIGTKRFGEVEIDLTMYDTAPHSFHLQLRGSREIQELSLKYQNILRANIKEAIPRINLIIAPPSLRKKDRFQVKIKKAIKSIDQRAGSCYGEKSIGEFS